jgi:hypothetical protein
MKNNWNLKNFVYNSEVSVDAITSAIRVFEILKIKYPNDELMDDAIDLLRDEICKMYGGTIYTDEI